MKLALTSIASIVLFTACYREVDYDAFARASADPELHVQTADNLLANGLDQSIVNVYVIPSGTDYDSTCTAPDWFDVKEGTEIEVSCLHGTFSDSSEQTQTSEIKFDTERKQWIATFEYIAGVTTQTELIEAKLGSKSDKTKIEFTPSIPTSAITSVSHTPLESQSGGTIIASAILEAEEGQASANLEAEWVILAPTISGAWSNPNLVTSEDSLLTDSFVYFGSPPESITIELRIEEQSIGIWTLPL